MMDPSVDPESGPRRPSLPAYRIEPASSHDIAALARLRAASLTSNTAIRLVLPLGAAGDQAAIDLLEQEYTNHLALNSTIAVKAVAEDGSLAGSCVLLYHDDTKAHSIVACPPGGDGQYWHYMEDLKVSSLPHCPVASKILVVESSQRCRCRSQAALW
jgi:hypothetical protein